MCRFMSNTVVGFLNLLSLLASIPIIGAGLWMARSGATCEHTLQTPLLVIGFVILVVSLVGFIGACFNLVWALWVYLVVMLCLIAAFMAFTAFGFVVTAPGGGVAVPGHKYEEYRLEGYSTWLRGRVKDPRYWRTIRSCLFRSRTCEKIASWTPIDYSVKDLSPIQSGCCKPPTSCVYSGEVAVAQDPDCYKWNNAPTLLCYDCDSCKAGAIEEARRRWHKISMLNVVVLLLLVLFYAVGCCAFQNARREDDLYQYPYGRDPRVPKIWPGTRRHDSYWWCC
ncbi:tetraspanin-5-like isoform X1 [Rhodamnia argentea]|uniref:Tetraspanin-5-like isoform X1 n=1 Tax=Rhodamnia argentea TaxID=178133 RepID=A0A8B8QF33_9MYRT|nr:tetraspanin-5-like isoform X1 [Rhodamnia argentea]